jgi:hypothetical protein
MFMNVSKKMIGAEGHKRFVDMASEVEASGKPGDFARLSRRNKG